jgi:hypothetical protein
MVTAVSADGASVRVAGPLHVTLHSPIPTYQLDFVVCIIVY